MAASAAAVAGSMLFFPLSVSPQLFAQDAKMENSFLQTFKLSKSFCKSEINVLTSA